jgi:hypothetical protein
MWQKTHMNVFGLDRDMFAILRACANTPQSISSIARISKLPRTSLLYKVRKLERRGMMRNASEGKRKMWQSVSFDEFRDTHAAVLTTFHDEGTVSIPVTPETSISIYRGASNLLKVFEKIGKLHQNERLHAIQPDSSFQSAMRKYPLDDILRLNKKIKDKKLIIEGIVHEKAVENTIKNLGRKKAEAIFKTFIGRLEDYVAIPDDFLDIHSEIYAFRDNVVIMSPEKEIAVEIIDKDLSEMIKTMLMSLKEHIGRRYSQNERMEKFMK